MESVRFMRNGFLIRRESLAEILLDANRTARICSIEEIVDGSNGEADS